MSIFDDDFIVFLTELEKKNKVTTLISLSESTLEAQNEIFTVVFLTKLDLLCKVSTAKFLTIFECLIKTFLNKLQHVTNKTIFDKNFDKKYNLKPTSLTKLRRLKLKNCINFFCKNHFSNKIEL